MFDSEYLICCRHLHLLLQMMIFVAAVVVAVAVVDDDDDDAERLKHLPKLPIKLDC